MLANFKNSARCFWFFTQQSWRFLYWWFYFGRSHSPGTGCFRIGQRLDISPVEYQPTHHTLWCQNCPHFVGWEADCQDGWLWRWLTLVSQNWLLRLVNITCRYHHKWKEHGKFYVQLVFHSLWQNHKKGPRSKSSSRQRQLQCCTSIARPNANYRTSSGSCSHVYGVEISSDCPSMNLVVKSLDTIAVQNHVMAADANQWKQQPEHVYNNNQRSVLSRGDETIIIPV